MVGSNRVALVFSAFSSCLMTEDLAREMVMAELSRTDLDPQFSERIGRKGGGNRHSFMFEHLFEHVKIESTRFSSP